MTMSSEQLAVILKSFDMSDEVRLMDKGKFEVVRLGGITIGRATYQPGWKWTTASAPLSVRHAVLLNTSGSCFPEPQRLPSMTVA